MRMSKNVLVVPPRSQRGLSLVELMIALLLGVVLTLGVTQVFVGSSQTYRTSDAIAFLQENLRFSTTRISRDARMAGYRGCLIGEPEEHLNTGNAAYVDELHSFDIAAIGWEAPNTGLGEEYVIAGFAPGGGGWTNGSGDPVPGAIAPNAIPGTDILVLNGAVRANVTLQGNPSPPATTIGTVNPSGIDQGTILLVTGGDCSAGDRFQKSNNANGNTITKAGGGDPPGNLNPGEDLNEYDDEASVYTQRTIGFFVGDGAGGEPALFQVSLEPGAADPPVELVSGVENFQVLYGISTTERRAERYVPADAVNDWTAVVSVRLGLLMRSGDRILDEDNTRTFNLVGTEIDPGADRRVRLVSTLTIGLRNRLE